MSGGAFEYKQFHIKQIADEIQSELDNQGKERDLNEWHGLSEYYEKYPEEKLYPIYSIEIQQKFSDAIMYLKLAYIHTNRIDRYLSADDGDESFLRRLNEELNQNKEDDTDTRID